MDFNAVFWISAWLCFHGLVVGSYMSGIGWDQHPFLNMTLLVAGTASLAIATFQIGWYFAMRSKPRPASPDRWEVLTKEQHKRIHALLSVDQFPTVVGYIHLIPEKTIDCEALARDLSWSFNNSGWRVPVAEFWGDNPPFKLEPDIWLQIAGDDPRLAVLKKMLGVVSRTYHVQTVSRPVSDVGVSILIGRKSE